MGGFFYTQVFFETITNVLLRDTKRQIRETPSAGTHLKNPASCPIFCV